MAESAESAADSDVTRRRHRARTRAGRAGALRGTAMAASRRHQQLDVRGTDGRARSDHRPDRRNARHHRPSRRRNLRGGRLCAHRHVAREARRQTSRWFGDRGRRAVRRVRGVRSDHGRGTGEPERSAEREPQRRRRRDQDLVADLAISTDAVDEVDSTAQDAVPVAHDGMAPALATAANWASGFIAGLVLGTMVLYYVLKDGPTMTRNWVGRRSDPARRATAQKSWRSRSGTSIVFGGQTALALINGVSITIGVYFLGVPGALAIGVVNFVGAYIPYIGAFIGGAFAVLMALGVAGWAWPSPPCGRDGRPGRAREPAPAQAPRFEPQPQPVDHPAGDHLRRDGRRHDRPDPRRSGHAHRT